MRPTFWVFLIIGCGAMFWMWNGEWDHNQPDPTFAAVVDCAGGPLCEAPWSECVAHADYPTGLCSAPCQLSKDCPGDWCCLPPGPNAPLRCLPPAQCKRRE